MVDKIKEILFSIWEDAEYVATSECMRIHFKGIGKTLEITKSYSIVKGVDVSFVGDHHTKKLFLRDSEEVEKYLREIITRLYIFHNEPEGFMKEVVTVDYDNCFDKNLNVVNYVRFKMLCGYDCFILTYRFDELNKYRYKRSPTNDDLWKNVKGFFPDRKVLFMNSKLKGEYLAYAQNVVEHIDDSMDEINSIRRYAPHVKRIWVDSFGNLNDMMSLYNKGQIKPTIINLN